MDAGGRPGFIQSTLGDNPVEIPVANSRYPQLVHSPWPLWSTRGRDVHNIHADGDDQPCGVEDLWTTNFRPQDQQVGAPRPPPAVHTGIPALNCDDAASPQRPQAL